MKGLFSIYQLTIGKKIAMALSGAILFLFVIGHMVGNLKAFQGQDIDGKYKLDIYAEFLRSVGAPLFGHGQLLWAARIVLLLSLLIHVVAALQLTFTNNAARDYQYKIKKSRQASVASRSMRITGVAVLFFIIYHILHFTTGTLHFHGFEEGHVYKNVLSAFKDPVTVCIYFAAMIFVSLHLYHGAWSMFQTLGLCTDQTRHSLKTTSKILSLIIVTGFLALPIAVYCELLNNPEEISEGKN